MWNYIYTHREANIVNGFLSGHSPFYVKNKTEPVTMKSFQIVFIIVLLLDDDEHAWIVKTCRKGWDENVGYKPDLHQKSLTKK